METTCNCGAVSVKITDAAILSDKAGHICHCSNCRKTAASAFSVNLVIDASSVAITGTDNLTVYHDKNSRSGNTVRRSFCKTCGNPIKSETDKFDEAGKVILKMGTFEKLPKPKMETFGDSKVDWIGWQEGTEGQRYAVRVDGEKLG